ncbi:MAG: T9SS type A sorting domain-containing protein [Saprospiraceae bacterium]|nr:T9SS type A sorting domain-containing protein [Saprospiraceae bacterium]
MKYFSRIILFVVTCLLTTTCLQAQPVYRSSSSNVGITSSATVSLPVGTEPGDLLVSGLMIEKGSTSTVTPPTGWFLIRRTNNSTNIGMATYYKVAGISEPGTYSFTLSSGSKWAIGCSRISNVNTSSPINASAGVTGNGTAVNAPSITTSNGNTLVLCYYTNSKNSTYSPHVSTTERYDNPYNAGEGPSNMMATFVQATTGATGNKVATASHSVLWVGIQIAISESLPLPIELLYFTATPFNHSSVYIAWSTATEINNDYFSIERSINGSLWETIKEVPGAGNSTQINHYQVYDDYPFSGISYYRLKQTDYNGTFTYAKIVGVDIQFEEYPQTVIYPNPTTNKISISGHPNELTEYTIFNLLGHAVRPMEIQENNTMINVDLSEFPAGEYLIKTRTAVHKVYKL